MRKELCPECGSKMIEDAFEEIVELKDGSIQIETIYPAWVCSDFCGYYVKTETNRSE
ncbi:YgiT-type zinc finger protein [Bacillus sp. ISL-37]|uniref:YgiT-type zinc finger protein n=1 Tax=Bacillus sp. ISL-37 TaxID=2819123 RepID=UPI001BE9A7E3|nr:YgiT-type zinc finger protein [Bacillus sp. ISL-37]MBT2685049.1 YgiT-type zinc finger protein [Bacillus sp. ISL-37]